MERIMHFDRYFTTMEYLMARYDRVGRQMGFRAKSFEEALAWQQELRVKLRSITGMDTMLPALLNPLVTERVSLDNYIRERVEIQTEPGIVMPVYVLLPKDRAPGEKRPAVITPHGHGSGGKLSPAGRKDIPAIADAIKALNYDYGVQLVREGLSSLHRMRGALARGGSGCGKRILRKRS